MFDNKISKKLKKNKQKFFQNFFCYILNLCWLQYIFLNKWYIDVNIDIFDNIVFF